MSFRANSFFELQITRFAAGLRGSLREPGIQDNQLIFLYDRLASWRKRAPSARFLLSSLLDSMLAGNRGRQKHGFPRQPWPHCPAVASLKEASLTNPECLHAGLLHGDQSTNIAHDHHHPLIPGAPTGFGPKRASLPARWQAKGRTFARTRKRSFRPQCCGAINLPLGLPGYQDLPLSGAPERLMTL
jgi:hypothetical protein